MTEAQARARILFYLPVDEEPVLSPGEVALLVDMARVVDVLGITPTSASYTETWDTHYAISQGWLAKAARLADRYLFMSGGKMFSRQQFYDHCMALHTKHAMKSPLKAVRLGPAVDPLSLVPSNAD